MSQGGGAPMLAQLAREHAQRLFFDFSCSPETGRLLRLLAGVSPSGRVAESGSGTGYGAAWLLDGLGTDGRLVTAERDPDRADACRDVFASDSRVTVLDGDWRLLDAYAPFDLFFCDGGGKRDDPDHVVELLAAGGILVLDDFTPSSGWPPMFDGVPDQLRMRYLADPRLHACEVRLSSDETAIVAVRRRD